MGSPSRLLPRSERTQSPRRHWAHLLIPGQSSKGVCSAATLGSERRDQVTGLHAAVPDTTHPAGVLALVGAPRPVIPSPLVEQHLCSSIR